MFAIPVALSYRLHLDQSGQQFENRHWPKYIYIFISVDSFKFWKCLLTNTDFIIIQSQCTLFGDPLDIISRGQVSPTPSGLELFWSEKPLGSEAPFQNVLLVLPFLPQREICLLFSLCISDPQPLSDACFANIFFPPVACLFFVLPLSFGARSYTCWWNPIY